VSRAFEQHTIMVQCVAAYSGGFGPSARALRIGDTRQPGSLISIECSESIRSPGAKSTRHAGSRPALVEGQRRRGRKPTPRRGFVFLADVALGLLGRVVEREYRTDA
jgi:hypothetical protein